LEQVVGEIPSLYAGVNYARLGHKVLELVSRFIPNGGCSFNEVIANRAGRLWDQGMPMIPLPRLKELMEWNGANFHRHPAIVHRVANPKAGALKMSDLLTSRQFEESPFFCELYSAFDYRFQLGGFCGADKTELTNVSFFREKTDFAERDRDLLNLLVPHIRQAMLNARRFTTLTDNWDALSRALTDRREALVMLDRDFRISGTAGPAFDLFGRYFDASDRRSDGLPGAVQRWLARRLATPTDATHPQNHGPLEISGVAGQLAVWLQADGSETWRLVLREKILPASREFSRVAGLTLRENEIFYWIGVGKSNDEIARLQGISGRTVNKHIQNIFAKLGVATRAEAIVSARQAFQLE
jgi:DNA-binding CsgD family transcriptional regulator